MTQNQNPTSPPKPIGTRYVVQYPNGQWVYDFVSSPFNGLKAIPTSKRVEALPFSSLKVASQVSDAIGGEVVNA